MCIAVYKPAGVILFEEVLRNCFASNPDGAGFSYAGEDGKIQIQKGYFTVEDFLEAYKEHENKECLLHFRIKTHGKIDEENCHPFYINDHISMIHNGIISGYGDTKKSDTREFIEKIIQPMVEKYGDEIIWNPTFQALVEDAIGSSKLMFLNSETGKSKIYNEFYCNTSSKVIFSNLSWQSKPKVWTSYNKKNTFDNYPDPSWWSKGDSDLGLPDTSSQRALPQHTLDSKIRVESLRRWDKGHVAYEVEAGDFMKVIADYIDKDNNVQGGDICTVLHMYKDNTLDLWNYSTGEEIKGVRLWALCQPSEKDLATVDWLMEKGEGEA